MQHSNGTNGSDGRQHVAVVGAGLAGLASAVELTTRGARVTLIDKNDHLGGKMNVTAADGFAFDMGPTILTLPEVLSGIIRRAGGEVSDYIDLVRLDPQWRCHYEDGTVIDVRDEEHAMRAHLDDVLGGGTGDQYASLLNFSRRMNRLSRKVFFYRDVGGIADVMRGTKVGDSQVMSDAMAMRLHATVAQTVHKHVSDPRLRQLIEHFLQYVGSSPFLAPTILTMIMSAQQDQGCWYSMGGTRMVARSLERLATEKGVRIVRGQRAEEILIRDGRASGVKLESGEMIDADAVVSNCDVQRTMRDLLHTPAAKLRQRSLAEKHTPACSGVVLYLGLDRQYEHLAHHNFVFSRDSAVEFDDIYRKGIPARDPTLYIAAPSRTDAAQAPPGGEALYILIHTPYIRPGSLQGETDAFMRAYRPVVMDKLSRFGMADIEDRIVVERSLLPRGIERMYNAEGGAIYGLASHGKLAGGFKPKNTSGVVDGLYLAGGSVNPGPGVPMVLMSGVTAADVAARDLGLASFDLTETSAEPGEGEWRPAPAHATA